MKNRILELALETLESRKAQIDEEIKEIKDELSRPRGQKPVKKTAPPKRKVSAATRKAVSERMEPYWAAKRKEKAAKAKGK